MSNSTDLISSISSSLTNLSSKVSKTERKLYQATLTQISKLKYVNGALINSSQNVKVMGELKFELNKLLGSKEYTQAVKEFGSSYSLVEKIQNEYFESMVQDFTPTKAVNIVKRTAISQMADNLIGGGVNQAVTEQAANILLQNIQSGSNVRKVTEDLRSFMIGSPDNIGALTKYSGQIATDSINQYAAAYNEEITKDLGFNWYQYVGSLRDTSREFCSALISQRYIHKSELEAASKGQLRIGKVSTAGMYKDTNGKNILVLRGGYNCKHQLRGIADKLVPSEVKILFDPQALAERELDKRIGALDRALEDPDGAEPGGPYNRAEVSLNDFINKYRIDKPTFDNISKNYRGLDLVYSDFSKYSGKITERIDDLILQDFGVDSVDFDKLTASKIKIKDLIVNDVLNDYSDMRKLLELAGYSKDEIWKQNISIDSQLKAIKKVTDIDFEVLIKAYEDLEDIKKIELQPYTIGDEWFISAKIRGGSFNITRTYSKQANKFIVDRDYFWLSPELQGNGFARKLLKKEFDSYISNGVDQAQVHANIDVGGYAWAKFGAYSDNPLGIERIISIKKSQGWITKAQYDEIIKILDLNKAIKENLPVNMSLLANSRYGKTMLLGSDWSGFWNIKDKDQMNILYTYLNK